MSSRILLLGALVFTAACSGSEDGITLAADVAPAGSPGAGCPAACTVAGGTLTLQHAYATVESAELLACETTADRILRWLAPIGTAHAHETGDVPPTRTSAPGVVDLAGSATIHLGDIHPPAARYCSVRVVFGPPDDDAVGLPDPEVVGKTLVLQGTSGSEPVGLASTSSRSVTVALAAPVTLDADHASGTLRVAVGGDGWLGQPDLTSAAAAEELVARIASGTTVEVTF